MALVTELLKFGVATIIWIVSFLIIVIVFRRWVVQFKIAGCILLELVWIGMIYFVLSYLSFEASFISHASVVFGTVFALSSAAASFVIDSINHNERKE